MIHRRLMAVVITGATLLPLFTGCWDRVDIEDRAFVMSVGVDLPEPPAPGAAGGEGGGVDGQAPGGEGGTGEKPASPLDQAGTQRYKMTLEIPILKNVASGGDTKGAGGDKTWVISSTGSSLFEINREFSTRLRRPPFYGHLRLLLVGEEAARQGLEPILDFFKRGTEMQRKIKVVVAEGKASEILHVNHQLQPTVAEYVGGELENITRTSRLFDMDIGRLRTESTGTGDILIPRVKPSPDKDEIKAAGAGVIKNMRLVGWLGEVETRAAVLAMGRSRGGIISVPAPPDSEGGGVIVYEILRETTNLELAGEGEDLSFLMRINIEGNIAEQTAGVSVLDAEHIAYVEDQVQKIIATEVETVIQKLQKEFGADVIGFGRVVQRSRPQLWKTLRTRWEEEFRDVPVEVRVTARVRRVGLER